MKKEVKNQYEQMVSTYIDYSTEWYVGSITFCEDIDDVPIDDDLKKYLQHIGLGFSCVVCALEDPMLDVSLRHLKTYYVTCPKCMNFENFVNALVDVGRGFFADTVMVWDREIGRIFATKDYLNYSLQEKFIELSIDDLRNTDVRLIKSLQHLDIVFDGIKSCTPLVISNPGPTAMTLSRKVRNDLNSRYCEFSNHQDFDGFLEGSC